MHRILGACFVSLLLACGGGGSSGADAGDDPGTPDVPTATDEGVTNELPPPDEGDADIPVVTDPGNPDHPGTPDEGPDGTTPLTVTVEPEDGARGVSVVAPITVTLNHGVASAAGDATTSLAWARGFNEIVTSGIGVEGELAVLGRTVTFTPDAPLAARTTYRFYLSGLETAAGAVPTIVVMFRTWENPIARQITWETATGIRQYTVHDYDDGVLVGARSFDGPGSDGIWQNDDDVQDSRTAYEAFEQGHWTRLVNYNGAGTDAQWGTGDDVFRYHQSRTFDENGQNTLYDSYSGVGSDGVPFSGDEPFGFRQQKTFDGRGLLIQSFQPTAPGPDATWFTADDTDLWPTVYTYDSKGLVATEAWYDGSGVMGGYTEFDHDGEGRMTEQRRYDAGPDGTFRTGDDFVQVQWVYVLP